ncbi:MAG TPA: HAD-IG family 5'-nucleotidase [Polyangiaceae bacterium]|nr:HAD-IG family 5'-nucleotidase [Polyangiaceae bacterium]
MNDQLPPRDRRIYCNRTLNLRGLSAIGFDMDYTLVNYHTGWWEGTAFNHVKERLKARGWPVEDIHYRPELCTIGLIIDTQLGNVIKADQYGLVRLASHGTKMLTPEEVRITYGHVPIDLFDRRWRAVDTLFSLSETSWFMQLVDRLDAKDLPGPQSYAELYRLVRDTLDATHMEGRLKQEIVSDPEKFVDIDAELPQALLDLKQSNKKLLLITNSEWSYTNAMMGYIFDSRLPRGYTWRDLFDLVFVQARKPSFFSESAPALKLVDERGLFEPIMGKLEEGSVYIGGNARLVEQNLGIGGGNILYFGDHIYADVHASKDLLRWRTALVVRELEDEVHAIESFRTEQDLLTRLMRDKELIEHRYSQRRLMLQRHTAGQRSEPSVSVSEVRHELHRLRAQLLAIDERIAPLARRSGQLQNERWGLLMRAGSDKSHLARQVARYADVYTSRVSNLLAYTPFVYLRAARRDVPHDMQNTPEF